MAGTADGPDGELIPNFTPDAKTGIGDWGVVDIVFALETGIKPDGDVFDAFMAEMVEDGTSHLTVADRRAIALLPALASAGPQQAGGQRQGRLLRTGADGGIVRNRCAGLGGVLGLGPAGDFIILGDGA